LGFPINDWTGGFNAWSRKALEKMDLEEVRSNGYSFQIELKYRASRRGFIGKEVPILFEDRRVGQSKMSFKIVLEALYKVWLMKWEIK
jgi:dolichol-phosphate mannosyltransferase